MTVLQREVFEWRATGDFQAEDRGNETQAEQFPGVQDSLWRREKGGGAQRAEIAGAEVTGYPRKR